MKILADFQLGSRLLPYQEMGTKMKIDRNIRISPIDIII